MGFWGWTMMLVFWAVVIGLVVWASRGGFTPHKPPSSNALDILERRFAAGEIDHDEFEEKKRILGSQVFD